jgi:hypothetical protein
MFFDGISVFRVDIVIRIDSDAQGVTQAGRRSENGAKWFGIPIRRRGEYQNGGRRYATDDEALREASINVASRIDGDACGIRQAGNFPVRLDVAGGIRRVDGNASATSRVRDVDACRSGT